MQTHLSPRPTASWLIATILMVAALHWIQVIAIPMAFALFLMALVWPMHRKLEKHTPAGVAVLVSILMLVAAAAALLLFIGYGLSVITVGLGPYASRIQDAYLSVEQWLEGQGIAVAPAMAEQFGTNWIFGLLQATAARLNAIAGFLALTVIFLAMGLLEVIDIRNRLPYTFGEDAAKRLVSATKEIGWKFRRYMLVRSVVSLLTGVLTWLFAYAVGLDLAIVWGSLAFALNFIPIIGSILAVIPPVLFAFVQFDSWHSPLLVLAGMTIIQFTIGNFLDPRLEGRALAISPLAVIVSIFFWGLVWGIPGAFIGVPLTIALMTVCHRFHQTCWIARLLTPLSPPAKTDEGISRP